MDYVVTDVGPGSNEFVNTYKTVEAPFDLVGTKKAVGAKLKDNQFEFGIFAGTELLATVKNAADGSIDFGGFKISETGTYTLTVRELSKSGGGWTTDATVHTITVIVTDDNEGTLHAEVILPAGGLVFTNTYRTGAATGDSANIARMSTILVMGVVLSAGSALIKRKNGSVAV
jgi:pilin isopeptide linkage protein